ncbi:hypothetical protein Pyn_30296 [Prunus yedoensis var. nudiflora]|uniref:Uncharacterized protein n=1 Tax=Prunus yedoensis var. nudiflora TaxID=2094558 RepID=A0A314ZAD9_PRUYE|nr:hypothetical protein Pyn_30296 [Prunus yedoensis var. nudiflora]
MRRAIDIHKRYEEMNLYRVFGMGIVDIIMTSALCHFAQAAAPAELVHGLARARGIHPLPRLDLARWSWILALGPPPTQAGLARWRCSNEIESSIQSHFANIPIV